MSEPATKNDLDQAVAGLRGEIVRVDHAVVELRGEMGAMEGRLIREIGQTVSQAANAMMEHVQTLISVVDEKYQDLPPQHAKLRADFDTHAADLRMHLRPPAAPPKRARRSRSR